MIRSSAFVDIELPAAVDRPILLEVIDLYVRFGGVTALDGISFDVPRGAVCGLIGPNGAGKTTLFNCLSRVYTPQRGSIRFDGVDISKLSAHGMAPLGIGRTFQNLALFPTMTVFENVLVGAHSVLKPGFIAAAFNTGKSAARELVQVDKIREIIALVGLSGLENRCVADLSFGFNKKVEIARALASDPKLLMLDEPAAGLNFEEVDALRALIRLLCEKRRITILLVEHHMNVVMRVSDKVVVLNFGRKIADGSPLAVQNDDEVVRAYLGDGL
jgi:branched-chain amino acid transport system ATP-binding protein